MKGKKTFNPTLYLVTDPDLSLGRPEEEIVRRAVSAGVTMVQYRDKDAPTRVMVEKTRILTGICGEKGVPLIVNDRLDVTLAGGADGGFGGKAVGGDTGLGGLEGFSGDLASEEREVAPRI